MKKNLSLRLLLADKDKEITRLKKELEEEKKAYINMYNMYVEKEEELKELNEIERIGRERHYHSKFLKDFQKERGKNVFPDHDEIYKRYDDYKSRVENALEYGNNCINKSLDLDTLNEPYKSVFKACYEIHERYKNILKGEDKSGI